MRAPLIDLSAYNAMRFRLRTLLIVLALGPPLLAGLYFWWQLVFEWTITSVKVLVVTVATFYVVVFIGMLAQKWLETYRRPNRPR